MEWRAPAFTQAEWEGLQPEHLESWVCVPYSYGGRVDEYLALTQEIWTQADALLWEENEK